MKIERIVILLLSLMVMGSSQGEELRDPRLRNEDISGAQIVVEVSRDTTGFYYYKYTVNNPSISQGTILTLAIDIGCANTVPQKGDLSALGMKAGSVSRGGNHVPVAIGGAITDGVSEFDSALWLVDLSPGEIETVQIVSGYGPGPRMFKLRPFLDPVGWDYATYNPELDPSVPWTADFTVTGYTRGPACPGEEEPLESPRFPGTLYPNESEAVNGLLTYSEPLRDRWHAEADSTTLQLTIHYATEMDPKTFRVLPEKHGLKRLFNPQPGSSETVVLPLEPGKNKIQLQAKARRLPAGKMKEAVEYGGRGPEMDQDEFEIRIGETGVGKGPAAKARGVP